jgi:hypothetical protein
MSDPKLVTHLIASVVVATSVVTGCYVAAALLM